MKIDYELTKIEKGKYTYYLLRFYYVFDSNKRFNFHTQFLKKYEYEKLGGK